MNNEQDRDILRMLEKLLTNSKRAKIAPEKTRKH